MTPTLGVLTLVLLAAFALPCTVGGETGYMKRGEMNNARITFQNARQGHVAFLGGSITEMEGYRPLVSEWLRKRFPETQFSFTNAGISSTCSTTGAFRLSTDVLAKGPVDLLFVDFAVNDDQDAHHTREECIRGMEGLVRQVRRHNPRAEVVFVYFVNEHLMDEYRKGRTPLTIEAHEAVAAHYALSTVNVARTVTSRIDAKTLTWKEFGGVHPALPGNRLTADLVAGLFDECWAAPPPAGAKAQDYALPAKPLDAFHYGQGRFVDFKEAKISPECTVHVPDWAKLPGGKRDRFTKVPLLEAIQPGATVTLEFTGTAVGAYVVAGPDAGVVEARVDGGETKRVDLLHAYSAGLHYPRTVLFGDALPPGKHSVTLTLSAEKNPHSKGTAFRALHLVANGPAPATP